MHTDSTRMLEHFSGEVHRTVKRHFIGILKLKFGFQLAQGTEKQTKSANKQHQNDEQFEGRHRAETKIDAGDDAKDEHH